MFIFYAFGLSSCSVCNYANIVGRNPRHAALIPIIETDKIVSWRISSTWRYALINKGASMDAVDQISKSSSGLSKYELSKKLRNYSGSRDYIRWSCYSGSVYQFPSEDEMHSLILYCKKLGIVLEPIFEISHSDGGG